MTLSTEVPFAKRFAQVAFAVFFCLTSAGVIFGFAALKPVLIDEGVYGDLCTPEEKEDPNLWVCLDQDTRLNFMFTISTVATNVVALPVGISLDRLGPRTTSLCGAVLFALGNFLFGYGRWDGKIDTCIAGYLIMAIGGPMIFLSSFHLSAAFPARAGTVLAMITGAFDASSVPYLFYKLAYQSGHRASLRAFFWVYLIIPAMIIIEQIWIGPTEIYTRPVSVPDGDPSEDVAPRLPSNAATPDAPPASSGGNLLAAAEDDEVSGVVDPDASAFSRLHYGVTHGDEDGFVDERGGEGEGKDPVVGALYGKSAGRQILSVWFILITLFLCVHMSRTNFYIQTCFAQLLYYTGNRELAEKLTTAFTVLLPLGGIVGVPFVGFLLDRRSTFDATIVLIVSGILIELLGLAPTTGGQIIGIAIFVLFRPLMYTFVSDFCAKVFGFTTFGTVYGFCNSISGAVGLICSPLDLLVKHQLHGNFTPVKLCETAAGILTSGAMSIQILLQARRAKKGAIELP